MRDACPHHREPFAVREKRRLFAHHKKMQPVARTRRLFGQKTVAERKRIGVHHHRADTRAGLFQPAELLAVTADAGGRVFKERRDVVALRERPEAAAAKALQVVRTRAEKQMKVAEAHRQVFHLHQPTGAEVFAAAALIHRHAFNHVARKPRAARDIALRHGNHDMRDVLIHPQLMAGEKRRDARFLLRLAGERYGDQFQIAHTSVRLRLVGRRRLRDGRFGDHIAQMADPLDFHLDFVARLHKERRRAFFTDAARRSGDDHIARA